MADQPDDIVVRILQEIQATLAEHGRMHEQHQPALAGGERRLEDIHEGMVSALGLAAHAHDRHESVDRRLDDLAQRVERLEKKT